VWQEYQVPVKYTTCKPVYEQHEREVPVTCYRTVTEPCQKTCKTYTCEPVWTERCVKVRSGSWCVEKKYCAGPMVTKRIKSPGCWSFDPCTCTSRYCPGTTTTCCVESPGRWVTKRTWVPCEEFKVERKCHMVRKEQCHVV